MSLRNSRDYGDGSVIKNLMGKNYLAAGLMPAWMHSALWVLSSITPKHPSICLCSLTLSADSSVKIHRALGTLTWLSE